MSDYAQRPASKKVTLVELDIGQHQELWFNSAAGMWYVIFSAIYPLIDPSFLTGVSAQTVDSIGSVASDTAQLLSVPNGATCQATEMSFFYDGSVAGGALYMHLQNGDEPSLHSITIGVVYGVAKEAGVYNGVLYEGRLISAPNISKMKDPLFFGRIAFGGGWITINNKDHKFDRAGEDLDLFGNVVRIRQGFDDQPFSAFALAGRGIMTYVRVGPDTFEVLMSDRRAAFSASVPVSVFDKTTYPNLKDGNVGKAMAIGYGPLNNVPCVCTNEAEGGPPANYSFKICDTKFGTGSVVHPIKAIITVRVDGVVKSTVSTDLTLASFVLSNANYTAGQTVTADVQGYADGSGNMIQNALDVIADLVLQFQGLSYIASAYNQPEWAATRTLVANIGLWQDEPKELYSIIEDICASARVGWISMDDGRLTARKFFKSRAPVQVLPADILLDVPVTEYDPSEVLSRTRVGYAKDWGNDSFTYLDDTSQEAAVFAKYKAKRGRKFDTLLTTLADAQAFSDDVMFLSAASAKKSKVRSKLQAIGRDIMEFLQVRMQRQAGDPLPGDAIVEISGVTKDLVAAETTFDIRLIEVFPETIYVQGTTYWGAAYYGQPGKVYGVSQNEEAA